MIDLRGNSGGNSFIIRPLRSGLKERLGKIGHVFVFIGPWTASSAVENATGLRTSLNATLVGEPTGENMGGYGEIKLVNLPNSKLRVQYSTKWSGSMEESKTPLTPDRMAPRSVSDTLSGLDTALDAASSYYVTRLDAA